jgi:hypothetical protein
LRSFDCGKGDVDRLVKRIEREHHVELHVAPIAAFVVG